MIAVEVLMAFVVVAVVIFGIAKIGAPIADAFAVRLKLKFQELGPEDEREIKARLSSLEEEVRTLKQLVANVQDTADFAVKSVKSVQTSAVESGTDIKISDKRTI
jgi:hypothetical protein